MPRAFDFWLILICAFVASCCSLSYELIIARFLTSLSMDPVVSQSVTIGCYLLALGLGAHFHSRIKSKDPLRTFMFVESILAISAALLMHAILFLHLHLESLEQIPWSLRGRILIFASQGITLWIGFLSGFEIPLLVDAVRGHTKRAFGWVLGMSYFGGLVSSLGIMVFVLPATGVLRASLLVALLTALVSVAVYFRFFFKTPRLSWVAIIISLWLPPQLLARSEAIEQFYLKSYYYLAPVSWAPKEVADTLKMHRHLPHIQRISSLYQEIDIVHDEYVDIEHPNDFHLFLDHRNQFGSAKERIYHELMIHGAMNITNHEPRDVLIIGGGDGLLIREILKYKNIRSVTLVELDPAMIDLAKNYLPLRRLNENALANAKVKTILGDGFEWVRRSRDQFDAIFVDLPHPYSVELSRLYSVEFFRFLERRLTNDGVLTFDFPFFDSIRSAEEDSKRQVTASVMKSVTEAGFQSQAAFGFWESFLVATKQKQELKFNYEKLSPRVSDATVADLAFINVDDLTSLNVRVNSVFQPRWLRQSFDGN